MGASKSEQFSQEHNQMANLMKALAHPARVAIFEHLLKLENCICGDLVDVLPLAQPTISQHLKELKSVGLIQGSVEGNSICYCLNEETVDKMFTYIQNIKQTLKAKNECC